MTPKTHLRAAAVAATCACFNIRKATRAVTQFYDDALRPSGLRITQFTLLVLLQRHGAMTINSLADAADTDPASVTRDPPLLPAGRLLRLPTPRADGSRIITRN